MENTTEIKNSMNGLNRKLDTTEKRLRKSPEQKTHYFRFKKIEKIKEKPLEK